jgi:plasmid rolling circle replication initiator protein Rep
MASHTKDCGEEVLNLLKQDNTKKKKSQEKILDKAASKRPACDGLADSFKRLEEDGKAARVRDCGTSLELAYVIAEDRTTLHRANFCRERLCPMCAMRRTKQIFSQVSRVMDAVERERPELVPVFLTLTVRNCEAVELGATLTKIFEGWNRMTTGTSKLKRIVAGWFRALEVTHSERDDTYHPHIHAIMLVPPSYFKNPKDYMPTEKWVKTWRKALRLDYDPVCHIEKIDEGGADGRADAVAEVAKYTVKDADYIKADAALTDKLVGVFGAALKGRRLYAFGGLMKEIAKRLKIDFKAMTPAEVTDLQGNALRKDVDYILTWYRWNIGLSRYEEMPE